MLPGIIKNIVSIGLCLILVSFAQAQKTDAPVRVIFDTDMGPDYDDVGAITLLHNYADRKKATILATIASTKYEGVAAVLDVLNTYFKRPDIPIGVPGGKAITQRDFQHWTDTLIARYPHTIQKNGEVPDAVALYRKILSQQPDKSVTIITVGFLTNIAGLLQSGPDQYSSLTGAALVEKKVFQMVSMAGGFPSGKEFNIREDAAAAKYVAEHWKRPLIFSGFEIGVKIKSGLPLVQNDAIRNSPVKDVFRIGIAAATEDREGRKSWDQTAVLVAIQGYEPFYTLKTGKISIAEDGSNTWSNAGKMQSYLIEKAPVSDVQKIINDMMMR